jgi:hypothetical protein
MTSFGISAAGISGSGMRLVSFEAFFETQSLNAILLQENKLFTNIQTLEIAIRWMQGVLFFTYILFQSSVDYFVCNSQRTATWYGALARGQARKEMAPYSLSKDVLISIRFCI